MINRAASIAAELQKLEGYLGIQNIIIPYSLHSASTQNCGNAMYVTAHDVNYFVLDLLAATSFQVLSSARSAQRQARGRRDTPQWPLT